MTLTFDLLTSKSIGRILDSWWVSVWSFMIIGWLQSQLSSGNHFQITMRHDLDLWPFDPKINRAHPWLMGSKCMKFHDHRWITESVIVRKLVWRTDRLTDRQTDGQTDRVQTYSPLRFHRWGTKKIIRPKGPAKKITSLRYCPKKIFWPRHKSQPPPPKYQMDRALVAFYDTHGDTEDKFST